jgi:hypothetical protein
VLIKTESIYKSNSNAKLRGLGLEAKWSNYKCREAQALLLTNSREVGIKAIMDNQS